MSDREYGGPWYDYTVAQDNNIPLLHCSALQLGDEGFPGFVQGKQDDKPLFTRKKVEYQPPSDLV